MSMNNDPQAKLRTKQLLFKGCPKFRSQFMRVRCENEAVIVYHSAEG